MTPLRHLAAGCLLALALTGCVSDTPPRERFYPPAAAANSVEQLSGSYCYFGPDHSVRTFRRGPESIPFLDVSKLWWPATIRVEATAERIVFTCTDETGYEEQQVFLPTQARAFWRDDALVLGPGRSKGSDNTAAAAEFLIGMVFNFWGWGERNRESRFFKSVDGQLVMTDSWLDSGWSRDQSGSGPYHYEYENGVVVIFEPSTGDCRAAMEGRPLQPRLDRGLDLRVPECAAQLEEQIASILLEKGEAAEVAGTLAAETVGDAVHERGDWAVFWSESPARTRYKFDVGRNKNGCVLRLRQRVKNAGIVTGHVSSDLWVLARRPLPGCTCLP